MLMRRSRITFIFIKLLIVSCHLKKFCEKEKRASLNEYTQFLADVPKHVDNFHFKGRFQKFKKGLKMFTFDVNFSIWL